MAKYGFNVTIGADTRPFTTALRQLNTPIQEAQNNLTKLAKGLKISPASTSLLADKQAALENQLARTKAKSESLRQALLSLDEEQQNNGGLTLEQKEKYTALMTEIDVTDAEVKALEKELRNFGSVGAQQLIAVGKMFEEVGKKITEVGEKLKVVSLVATAGLGAIIKTSVGFEDAWVGVTKTVDGTEEELAKVRQEIIDMSKATGISKNEIAGVAQVAGQLGIATGDLSKFTKVMVDLGVATDMTAEDAAMKLARLANITQMSANDYDRLGATITDLGNHYATTESEIVDMATRLAATGDLVGLNQAQIMALSTAMSSLGSEAEAGGTAMSKIFKKMQLAIETNSKTLPKFAKVAGMTTAEFKEAFEKDALGALNSFIKGLAQIEENGGSAVATLDDMKLSEVRLSDALLRLVGSGDLLDKTMTTANKAWEENAALTKESQKRYDEVLYQWGQVKETLGEIAIDLGEILLPIIKEFLGKVKDWLEGFTNMDEGTRKMIVTIMGVTAVISPLLIVIGKIVSAIGVVIGLIGKAKIVIAALTAILGIPVAPILLIVGAVAAVGTALVVLYNKCEWFRNGVNNIVNAIKDFVLGFFDTIKVFFTETIPSWIDNVEKVLDNLPYYIGVLIGKILAHFVNLVMKLDDIKNNTIPNFINKVKDTLSRLPEIVKHALAEAAIKLVLGFIDMSIKTSQKVEEIKQKIKNGFDELPERLFEAGVNAIAGLIRGITNKANELREKVTSLANGIRDGFTSALNIHSPSKVMRDLVGKNIVLGIEEGFMQTIGRSTNNMQEALLGSMSELNYGRGGGLVVNIYTQELDSQKLDQIVRHVDQTFGAVM